MRTLILAGLTMVTALGASAADAQRLGYGAPYPVPGREPGGNVPGAPPPMIHAPGVPQGRGYRTDYPQQRPYPAQSYPQQSYPQRSYARNGASRWGASAGGRWSGGTYAPGGWNGYRRPSRGYRVPSYWISPNFYIGDYGSYGLATPPAGYSWHRYYDDAVLLDQRGKVWDSVGGLDWDGAGYGAEGGYDGEGGYASSGYGYAEGGAGGGYAMPQPAYAPLPPVTQAPVTQGYVTTYRTGGYQGGYSGATTVVTIQPTETVTTTTTEYIEESTTRYAAPRRVYRAPKRHYRPVVRRRCGCQVEQPVLGS